MNTSMVMMTIRTLMIMMQNMRVTNNNYQIVIIYSNGS